MGNTFLTSWWINSDNQNHPKWSSGCVFYEMQHLRNIIQVLRTRMVLCSQVIEIDIFMITRDFFDWEIVWDKSHFSFNMRALNANHNLDFNTQASSMGSFPLALVIVQREGFSALFRSAKRFWNNSDLEEAMVVYIAHKMLICRWGEGRAKICKYVFDILTRNRQDTSCIHWPTF